MKIPHSLKNGPLILTAALSISLGFASSAFATTSWLIDPHRGSVIQLGSLGGDTYATDISDAGQVVGVEDAPSQGSLEWDRLYHRPGWKRTDRS